jgi:hypothetical protein
VRLPWPIVDPHKVRDYLLSPAHPVGRFKAAFFSQLGYEQSDWLRLQRELIAIGSTDAVDRHTPTHYGDHYEIVAELEGPFGLSTALRTVWLVRHGDGTARFITAYPDDVS